MFRGNTSPIRKEKAVKEKLIQAQELIDYILELRKDAEQKQLKAESDLDGLNDLATQDSMALTFAKYINISGIELMDNILEKVNELLED